MAKATTTVIKAGNEFGNAWPIDTPERILKAMAGSEGSKASEVAEKSGLALSIVNEWLTEKVRQGLLLFDGTYGTYCSLCRWPSVAAATNRAS